MKINSTFALELKRDDNGFMTGNVTVDGISQRLAFVPRGVEILTFFEFFQKHVVPAIQTGKHGNVPFRKGRN